MIASEGVKDMRISISGKNLEVSDYMRETAEKTGRLPQALN